MKIEKISIKEARSLILSSQGLIGSKREPLQIIEHLGYVQIDTISVIERAHHHVFWTRNEKYQPSDLDQLVSSRKVFEYWSHAASFLPMKDYRYTLPMKRRLQKDPSAFWYKKEPKAIKAVLKRIEREGPLSSKNFKNTEKAKSTVWGSLKPAKKALERLFMEGRLEITRRDGFQKVYDLTERVIPGSIDRSMPTKKEYNRFLIERTLRHHGLATAEEIAYLKRKETKEKISKELQEMLASGEVIQLQVEGIDENYFALKGVLDNLPRVNSKILILSPFDNMIIQRKKLNQIFNFDYQIECYVPESKRKYGYFCLPVFQGIEPFARIDCKADRKEKVLNVQSVHYEKGVDRDMLKIKLDKKLKSFAKFNGCDFLK